MRNNHREIFKKAAKEYECLIAVRQHNPKSEPYIGKRGYKPKPIQCKAKTAKKGPQAGLVVNPKLCPDAFRSRSERRLAEIDWHSFDTTYGKPQFGYQVNKKKGDRYGCVMFGGNYLYSDYDLMEIKPYFETNQVTAQNPIFGKYDRSVPSHKRAIDKTSDLEKKIATFVYNRTGILIQHGAAVNENKNEPPKSEQCHVFRPTRPFYCLELWPKKKH